jgi:excisionase family DNA binding protein
MSSDLDRNSTIRYDLFRVSEETPALSPVPPPPAFTVDQVAAALQVHPQTVRKLIADGEIRSFKVGSQFRVTAAALAEYIRQSEESQ